MFKGLWEKVKGRNLLKLESHCDTDFFKQKLTCLSTGSMRKPAVGGGWIWVMNKVLGGLSSMFYNLLGHGSHIWIAHD